MRSVGISGGLGTFVGPLAIRGRCSSSRSRTHREMTVRSRRDATIGRTWHSGSHRNDVRQGRSKARRPTTRCSWPAHGLAYRCPRNGRPGHQVERTGTGGNGRRYIGEPERADYPSAGGARSDSLRAWKEQGSAPTTRYSSSSINGFGPNTSVVWLSVGNTAMRFNGVEPPLTNV